ncbi:beta-ketoacyl synthase N-terminal-like domain-containing protein [Nocardia sp. CA-135953]|uniref:beta-ketoacyl synthase N-terminal-like domain-containing protein n=1 Tax=Nocardia sp. CA-135953 TaxID=3239978 RepID=UPI003D998AB7
MIPTEPVVSGIGVVSPRGRTPSEMVEPPSPIGPEPWFDYRTELGRHGYKYFPPACHYLLAATRRAVADSGCPAEDLPAAAAIGTNNAGSVWQSELDRTIVGADADELSPMTATFFSINLVAGQLAIEHELTGFNLTFTSPRVAGVEALGFGSGALALGRTRWLLAGATEARLDAAEPGAAESEEGAAILVVEPAERVWARGATAYGRCTVRSGFLPPDEVTAAGARTRLDTLFVGGVSSAALPVVAVLDDSAVGAAVARALAPEVEPVIAGPGCLEPLLRLAWCLAEGPPQSLLITAASTGNIAVAHVDRRQLSA